MRKPLTVDKLHDLITRKFRKTAGDNCLRCRVPMPTYFAGARDGPNWRVGSFEECGTLCHTILQDVVEKVAGTYDLRR